MHRKDLEWQRYNISLADGGPYYAETDPSHLLVEPWNAFSSLFLLLPAIFWAYKIRENFKENLFIAYCIPLLVLGGLGSTLFHAFRSSSILLYMDILPILILTFSVSTYFWHKVFNNWWLTILTLVLSFSIRTYTYHSALPIHTKINLTYAINGISIFLPILIVLIRSDFRKFKSVILSVILFALALFFREIDARTFVGLPMGTNFLWHILSAAGAYYLAEYLYFVGRAELKNFHIRARKNETTMAKALSEEAKKQVVQ